MPRCTVGRWPLAWCSLCRPVWGIQAPGSVWPLQCGPDTRQHPPRPTSSTHTPPPLALAQAGPASTSVTMDAMRFFYNPILDFNTTGWEYDVVKALMALTEDPLLREPSLCPSTEGHAGVSLRTPTQMVVGAGVGVPTLPHVWVHMVCTQDIPPVKRPLHISIDREILAQLFVTVDIFCRGLKYIRWMHFFLPVPDMSG